MNVVINGVDIENVDFTEAETADAFDEGRKIFEDAAFNAPKKFKKSSEVITAICDAVRSWADKVFYEGAGDDVLPVNSLFEAQKAAADMIDANNAQHDALLKMSKEASAAWAARNADNGNRAQRRAADKQKRKKRYSRRKTGNGENSERE